MSMASTPTSGRTGLAPFDLTVLELAIAIVCTRKPGAALETLAEEVGRRFGSELTPLQLELPVQRMIARADLVADARRYAASDLGRVRAEAAARSLVHLFFRDRYFFDVRRLLEVAFNEERDDAR